MLGPDMPDDDLAAPVRTALALLTAGVDEDGLPIFKQVVSELDREDLIDVLVSLVGFTRQLVTDEQLQSVGLFLA